MSWTYSGNPGSSAKDYVRFLIGDTDVKEQLLTDEEIEFLISETGSTDSAAVRCCDAIIAKLSKDFDYSLGPESGKVSQRLTAYRDIRRRLSRKTSAPSAELPSAIFKRDLMSNK